MRRRKKKLTDIVLQMRRIGLDSQPWNVTFAPIPTANKKEAEVYLKRAFETWWFSWIEPNLKEIEALAPKSKDVPNIFNKTKGTP